MSPEVSIITCSLSGKELSRTINSVLAQDFTDYEIVIVEDGSSIPSKEIIETFKPETIFQLKPLNIGNDLIIDLPNELKGNFNNTKLVLKDGTEVPDWLEYDPVTGQIIAENPPEDVSQLELKLIIEQDGKIIVTPHGFLPGKDTTEEKASIEKYKKEYAEYWKEIVGVDGDFDLKAEKEEVE